MSVAGRRSNSAATPKSRAKRARRAASTKAKRGQSLEYNILLTATLCLLAFGAVMVYSASSASSLLASGGSGMGELVRFVLYGALGLFLMRVLARDGIRASRAWSRLYLPSPSCSCSPCTSLTSA